MASVSPRILVFGTGSVGAVYAWLLSRAISPKNVYCTCRSNYAQASTNGFTINSTHFGNNINFRPNVVRNVSDAVAQLPPSTNFTHVVVTAKAIPSTPSIASQLSPAISPNTAIVLIQNGVSIEQEYSTLYPANALLSCVVYLPATQTSPAIISHKEIELLHIGTYPTTAASSHKTAAQDFSNLLTQGGASSKVHDDIQPIRWSKLLVNASWNPICALSLSRDVQFLHSSPSSISLTFLRDLMLEISSIATALGYASVDSAEVDRQIERASVRELPGVEPSMLADAKHHARMEVDAIVGNAVRLAEEKGVQVPLLRGVYALVKALDESFAREKGTSS